MDKKKQRHNVSEQRRREKINKLLNELKGVVPNCKNNKYNILERTIQHIKQLIATGNTLLQTNCELEKENYLLYLTLQEYKMISTLTLSSTGGSKSANESGCEDRTLHTSHTLFHSSFQSHSESGSLLHSNSNLNSVHNNIHNIHNNIHNNDNKIQQLIGEYSSSI
jgi:hypothetical protein